MPRACVPSAVPGCTHTSRRVPASGSCWPRRPSRRPYVPCSQGGGASAYPRPTRTSSSPSTTRDWPERSSSAQRVPWSFPIPAPPPSCCGWTSPRGTPRGSRGNGTTQASAASRSGRRRAWTATSTRRPQCGTSSRPPGRMPHPSRSPRRARSATWTPSSSPSTCCRRCRASTGCASRPAESARATASCCRSPRSPSRRWRAATPTGSTSASWSRSMDASSPLRRCSPRCPADAGGCC